MRIRAAVSENRLSDPASISDADYEPFIRGRRCWVAEAEGEIVGFAALDAEAASVWALFVSPEAEGKGAGRLLLGRLVREARRLKLRALRLTTQAGSRAERLYLAGGWKPVKLDGVGALAMELAL